MATRLKQTFRDEITRLLMADTIDPLFDAHREAGTKLANEIYEVATTPAERKAFEVVKDFLQHERRFRLNVRGMTMDLDLLEPRPSRWHGWNCERYVVKDEALQERVIAHHKAGQDLIDKHQRASNQIDVLLRSVTTFEALSKTWPEGEPYYKSVWEREAGRGGLPAVEVKHVNAIFGIPKPATKG